MKHTSLILIGLFASIITSCKKTPETTKAIEDTKQAAESVKNATVKELEIAKGKAIELGAAAKKEAVILKEEAKEKTAEAAKAIEDAAKRAKEALTPAAPAAPPEAPAVPK